MFLATPAIDISSNMPSAPPIALPAMQPPPIAQVPSAPTASNLTQRPLTYSTFELLQLPAELRMMVYEELVLSELRDAKTDGTLSLLQSCRQICNELKPMVLKVRLFLNAANARPQRSQVFRDQRVPFLNRGLKQYARIGLELSRAIFKSPPPDGQRMDLGVILYPYFSVDEYFKSMRAKVMVLSTLEHRDQDAAESLDHPFVALLRPILLQSWGTITFQHSRHEEPARQDDHAYRCDKTLFQFFIGGLWRHTRLEIPPQRIMLKFGMKLIRSDAIDAKIDAMVDNSLCWTYGVLNGLFPVREEVDSMYECYGFYRDMEEILEAKWGVTLEFDSELDPPQGAVVKYHL